MTQDFKPVLVKSNIKTEEKKTKRSLKLKMYGFMFIAILAAVGFYKIVKFFDHNQIVFQNPVHVGLQTPVYIAPRDNNVKVIREVMASENINPLTPDQQYLCNKFGKDCVTALAIFRAESGMNNKAINVNKDGSVDFGCMQINSVHLKKIDTSKVNLLNCQDNIDVAYTIFKSWGNFKAWAAYNNGAYKKYLIN